MFLKVAVITPHHPINYTMAVFRPSYISNACALKALGKLGLDYLIRPIGLLTSQSINKACRFLF